MISLGDYTFCLEKRTGPKTRWRCSTHKNKGCKAAIVTIEDEIVRIVSDHNH